MKKTMLALAMGTLALGAVSAASAATVTYNEWSGLYGDGLDHTSASYSQTVGGVTLTISANTTGHSTDLVAYRPNQGLGVLCSSGCIADSPEMGSDLIKGSGREVLTFTFSQAVNLSKIGFYLFDNNIDQAQLKYGSTTTTINSAPTDNTGKPIVGFSEYVVSGSPLVTSFSVAATGSGTSFRISDITVDAPTVPVPAAAWLMGSGLLGLAGIARRRQSA